jgi:hypothetical protein
MVELLLRQLELSLFVLWMITPILLLLRSAQLTLRWGIHHAILKRSTTRTTTIRGSMHYPLPLLLVSLNNNLHQLLFINGGTSQVIVGQVGGLIQALL